MMQPVSRSSCLGRPTRCGPRRGRNPRPACLALAALLFTAACGDPTDAPPKPAPVGSPSMTAFAAIPNATTPDTPMNSQTHPIACVGSRVYLGVDAADGSGSAVVRFETAAAAYPVRVFESDASCPRASSRGRPMVAIGDGVLFAACDSAPAGSARYLLGAADQAVTLGLPDGWLEIEELIAVDGAGYAVVLSSAVQRGVFKLDVANHTVSQVGTAFNLPLSLAGGNGQLVVMGRPQGRPFGCWTTPGDTAADVTWTPCDRALAPLTAEGETLHTLHLGASGPPFLVSAEVDTGNGVEYRSWLGPLDALERVGGLTTAAEPIAWLVTPEHVVLGYLPETPVANSGEAGLLARLELPVAGDALGFGSGLPSQRLMGLCAFENGTLVAALAAGSERAPVTALYWRSLP